MSNTASQQPYATKSMNGIVVYDDGAGTTISGGVVSTNTINLQNLNINEIQGILPADNITLYTDTTGDIQFGDNATNLRIGDFATSTYVTGTALNLIGLNNTLIDTTTDTTIQSGGDCNITSTNDNSITSLNNTNITAVANLVMDASGNTRIGDNSITTDVNGQTLNLGNTLGSNNINLGNGTGTNYLYLNSKTFTGIYSNLSTGSIDFQANQVSICSGLGKTVFLSNIKTTASGLTTNGITDFAIGSTSISGKVKITGAQRIEPSVAANGLKIGEDITSANLILGNATYPPICNATATTGKQITNYDTVLSMISAGSPIIKADEIQTYTAGGTLVITATAMTCNALTLAMNSAITFNDFVNVNELTPKPAATDMYLWTAAANLSNIWLGPLTAANTAITNIAQNNGVINIGIATSRTANIGIGTGTSFSGAINIGTASGLANTVRLGAAATSNLLLRGLTTTMSGGTATLSSTTTTISGTTTNINTASGTTNIGGGTSICVLAPATLNINATTINIGGAGTTAINLTDPMNPTYVYSATTGTNVVGSIGYIYTQALPTPANGTVWGGSPSAQTYASISVEAGVYCVSATMTILGAGTTNLQQVQASIGTGTPTTEYVNRILQSGGASTTLYYSISGVVSIATATTINCALYIFYSGGAPLVQHTGFKYSIARIA